MPLSEFQMLWDCPNCGTEKLLGLDHRFCPACGTPQDPEKRYFPEEADKIAVEDHQFTGADRHCPSCDTANAALAEFCAACGSPMEGSTEAKQRGDQLSDTSGQFEGDSSDAARQEHRQAKLDQEAARKAAMAGEPPPEEEGGSGAGVAAAGMGLGMMAMLAVGFVMVGLCCGLMFWKQEATIEVTGHTWERTVVVEANKLVKKSDWKDSVPSKAKNVRCSKEKRSTKKVKDGETCKTRRKDNGDGTFTEKEECKHKYKEEPVYDEKCSYEIKDWTRVRTAKADGTSKKPSPKWPNTNLKSGEREGKKDEKYVVSFEDDSGKKRSCKTSEKTWASLDVGSSYTGSVSVVGGGVDCSSLKKN
jgi:hypothetical protein